MTTVLYIDGDHAYRSMLSRLLVSCGLDVVTAEDGLEGIRIARQLRPSLILLDLHLPRIDGFEVIAQLRGSSSTWNIPIVFLSLLPANYNGRLAREVGVEGFVTKPFHSQELIRIIQRNLGTNPAQAEGLSATFKRAATVTA